MSDELTSPRKVTLFYTQSNERKSLQTTARTWGELSRELGEDFSKSKVVLQESRMTLENTEAILPVGEFTLFLFPINSKAGGTSNKDRDWSMVKYNKLRGIASKLNKTKNANIPMNGSKNAIAAGVSKFYGGSGKFTEPTKPTKKVIGKAPIKAPTKDKKSEGSKLNEKLSKVNSTSKISPADYNDVIYKLDTIISKLDKAIPNMDTKELDKLSQLASTVRSTMQRMD